MDFISNQSFQIEEMLETLGLKHIEELFKPISKSLLMEHPKEDDGLSEMEGFHQMVQIAKKNDFCRFTSYLGAGAYDHYIPAIVPFICQKSEFLTAYTPYQAEASQGILQAMFEFQTAMARLTDLEVANASLYDGASACAEGLLMAYRFHQGKRSKIFVPKTVHPHYREVIDLYLRTHEVELVSIDYTDEGYLAPFEFDQDTAAILLPYPNFFGVIEDYSVVIEEAKKLGIITVMVANPLMFALFRTPGEMGVDIAVGDAQPLGIPLNFGGPYVGYVACQKRFLRQMPGRLVGKTTHAKGEGFVLTLQAREQHIRREKATSNICTNQALSALAVLVFLSWYGKEGLKELALTNYQRCEYLKKDLKLTFPSWTFNEFVTKVPLTNFEKEWIVPGLDLGHYYKELKGHHLICVTETKSRKELDYFKKLLLA